MNVFGTQSQGTGFFSGMSNTVSNAYGNAGNAFSRVTGRVSGAAVAVVIVVLLAMAVLGWVVYRFLSNSLESTTLLDGIIHCRTGSKTVAATKLPTLNNGKEWAVSLWMYIDEASHTTQNKSILSFGDMDSSALLVVLDKNSNRMYIILKTTRAAGTSAEAALTNFIAGETPATHVVVPIEYAPLSRWLNAVVVVDQNVVSLYLDGDIYSVTPVDRFAAGGIIVDPDEGDILIGSSSRGMNGYVAKVQFFNHAINFATTKHLYSQGPGKGGILNVLGVSKYKLQWPITSATS